MQGVQIPSHILQSIFLSRQIIPTSIIKQLSEWTHQLDPSINMTQSIISTFLLQQSFSSQDIKQNCYFNKAIENMFIILFRLMETKAPKNFVRAFFLFIKRNLSRVKQIVKLQIVLDHWKRVNPQLLESYCDAFNVGIQKYLQNQDKQMLIPVEEFDNKIFQLINKKQYPIVMSLIKLSNCQTHHINCLLQKMTTNKQASKAADYIKSLKLDPSAYPLLNQRLYKTTARHFLSKNGWQYVEQIFESYPQALACVIQDLVYKKKFQEAIAIYQRNKGCRSIISKQQAKEYFILYQKQHKEQRIKQGKQIIHNFLHKDLFGPPEPRYLALQELGIREEQVVWVDNHSHSFKDHLADILNSDILGIDTQSIVGQTKLDKSQTSKFQQAALIQISTGSKVFIFDGLTIKQEPLIKQTIISYIEKNGLIVGHTLASDIQSLLSSLGLSDTQIKSQKSLNLIDIWKLFKSLNPQSKYSSLAYITQKTLGKQLCKQQTLSNWARRPLRRNQLHYAAMDAVVVLKIYQKWLQEMGEQMIRYYCEMGNADF